MAKSKYAPALFEVMKGRHEAKPSAGVALPKWWKSAPDKPQQPPEPPPAADPEEPVSNDGPGEPADSPAVLPMPPVVSAPVPAPVVEAPVRHELPDPETRPYAQMRDGRVELSLTPVQAAVAAGIVVIVILSSYLMGRHRGEVLVAQVAAVRTEDPLASAMNQPVNPKVLDVQPAVSSPPVRQAPQPSGQQARAAAVTPRVPPPLPNPNTEQPPARDVAQTFVVIETFKAEDKASAEFAQKWLEAKQISTRIDHKAGRWRLVSAAGFAAGEEQKLQQYVESVKALGRECGRDMGRAKLSIYRFSSPGKTTGRDVE
jgi:hypothetical protein